MSTQGTIHRLTLIIEKVKQGFHPTIEEIHSFLNDQGFSISKRTLQRDFTALRIEYGIEITYSDTKRGYFLDLENSLNVESFIRFLEIVNTANLLTKSLQESKNALDYISFDSAGGLKGIEHLSTILTAIKSSRKLRFEHKGFQSSTSKKYKLRPYLLKEYNNRWYVVGKAPGIEELRTFGIDRLENLEVTTETFEKDPKLKPKEKFLQTIGLVYNESEVTNVVLSFTPDQGKYIASLPLHASQKVLIDNDTEYRIQLRVYPNYELKQLILMHSFRVKVIEPKWFANEIANDLQRAVSNYKK